MSDEVFFDLEKNEELEGSYFSCPYQLIDAVFALIENGYEVIGCQLNDVNYIYLNEENFTIPIGNSVSVEEVIQEKNSADKYIRVLHTNDTGMTYDGFSAKDVIEIKILGNHHFSHIPPSAIIFNFDNYTVIRIRMKKIEIKDLMYGYPRTLKKLNVSSAINDIESWVESITGKPISRKEKPSNSYGNSYFAIDYDKKELINAHYIALDALMVPIIKELRNKGYETLGCCSGHYDRIFVQNTSIVPEESFASSTIDTWIIFSNESPLPTPPEGAKVEDVYKYYRISYSCEVIDENGVYKSAQVIKQEIEESVSKLLEWSRKLPPVDSLNHNRSSE